MKKMIILSAAAMLLLGAMTAQAASDMKGGLGFHVGTPLFSNAIVGAVGPEAAPTLGIRQWVNSQVGFDLGVGFTSFKAERTPQKETWTGFGFEIGVPISIKKFDKANFIFRPGFQYGSLEDKDESAIPTVTTKWTGMSVSGELEVELMLADNVSISASHGLAYTSLKNDETPELKFTNVGSTGNNFTNLGFKVYLW